MTFNPLDYGKYPPVQQMLGPRTFELVKTADAVRSCIIHKEPKAKVARLADCALLAEGRPLTAEQIQQLRSLILLPHAHYNGKPLLRRPPSVPNFAFQMARGEEVLDVLVDLINPGWEFYCGQESYRNWNWVGAELVVLAKALFPKLASDSPAAVWKRNVIHVLKRRKGIVPQPESPTGG